MVINGSEGLRQALITLFTNGDGLKNELAFIENERGLASGSVSRIPTQVSDSGLLPKHVVDYEDGQIQADYFPAIIISPTDIISSTFSETRSRPHPALPQPIDEVDEGDVYRIIYAVNLLVYVLGQTYGQVENGRGRLELAIRRHLHRNLQLGTNAYIDKNSYRVKFQPEVDDRYGGYLDGFQITIQVISNETLATISANRAVTITSGVERLAFNGGE